MVAGAIAVAGLAVVGVAMSGRLAARSSMAPAPAAPVAPVANTAAPATPQQAAAAYAIPSEVKDEVSASLPRRAPVERPAPAPAAEARAADAHLSGGARKVAVAPAHGKHPATRPEPPRAVAAHPAGAPLPIVDAPGPAAAPEPKKRAQLVDDQHRVKLIE